MQLFHKEQLPIALAVPSAYVPFEHRLEKRLISQQASLQILTRFICLIVYKNAQFPSKFKNFPPNINISWQGASQKKSPLFPTVPFELLYISHSGTVLCETVHGQSEESGCVPYSILILMSVQAGT